MRGLGFEVPVRRAISQSRDRLAHAGRVPSCRRGAAQKATGAPSRAFDEPPVDVLDLTLDPVEQGELDIGRKEGTRLTEEPRRMESPGRRGTRHLRDGLLAQREQQPGGAGRMTAVGHDARPERSKELPAELVHASLRFRPCLRDTRAAAGWISRAPAQRNARPRALTGRPRNGTVTDVSAHADRGIVVVGGHDPLGEPCSPAAVAGLIVDGAPSGESHRFDADGLLVAPGFVDLQVNGAAGIDLTSEPERLWEVAAALPRFGVTSFLPTIVTSPAEVVERALRALAAGPPEGWVGARPLGLHLEGPMISSRRRGAHASRHVVTPSPAVITGWSADAGVAMVTIAPELPGAMAVIAELAGRGVVVSAGHTDADDRVARDAVAAGVRAVTHLFNAMAPLCGRDPGLVGATLAGLPVIASLIADGAHLHPNVLTFAWRALGPDRRMLVSDATAALGAPPGGYRLGALAIASDGVRAWDPGTGRPAGSAAGLDAAVRNVVAITGCEVSEAIAAATSTPAGLLGRAELGTLDVGSPADMVLLDADLRVVATIVRGVVVHRRDPS